MQCKRILLAMVFCLLSVGNGFADQVINDDLIVQGGMCVGQDCVNGEDFSSSTVKLKENNLRIGFYDTTSSSAPTERWQISANDSNNGGDSYMAFETAIDGQEPSISDGGALGWWTGQGFDSSGTYYSCGQSALFPGCIPAGDQIYDAAGDPVMLDVINTGNGLKILAGTKDGIVLGEGSTTTYNSVSVGSSGNERRLANVAVGVDPHDVVTLDQMNSLDPMTGFNQQLVALADRYDEQFSEANNLEDGVKGAAAVAAAFSALSPNARAVGNNHLGLGVGSYRSSVAIAAGYFRVLSPSTMINLAFSSTDDLDGAISRVGYTYQW